jgi:hypothetical protein
LVEALLRAMVAAAQEMGEPAAFTEDLVYDMKDACKINDWRALGAICHEAHTKGDYTLVLLAGMPHVCENSCADFVPQTSRFRLLWMLCNFPQVRSLFPSNQLDI